MNIHRRRTILSRAVGCESLERRMLLSLSPVGLEFRVNTFITNSQSNAATAVDADGDFVVTWDSIQEGGGGVGIYAQRYNAAGLAQGAEFHVNVTTTGGQQKPAVAMDANGDFVIVWSGVGPGDSDIGVFAQRYNAAGVPQGGEFHVNTFTTDNQTDPAVASDAAGNFVVSWTSPQDGSGQGVYAQRYNAGGGPQGSEFRVNTFTTGNQSLSSAAMDASGDFAIAWGSASQDGSGYGVYAQRYNAAGVLQGGEFRVNTFTTNSQAGAALAMDSSGDFVVAWFSPQDAPGNYGVYAQRYNASGLPQGGEFRVNTTTASTQFLPSVAMDADGDFLVAWASYGQDGSDAGVYAQSFNASAVPQGIEFRVNTFTAGNQNNAAVAMDADGDAVVAWRSINQDGSGYGVYAQRYSESNPDTAPPMVGGLFIGGEEVMPAQQVQGAFSAVVVSFSEDMSVAGGAGGANSATNPANHVLLRNGADFSGQIASVAFAFNAATRKFEAALTLSFPLSDAQYILKARDTLRDLSGNELDGNLDGDAGGDFARSFSVDFPVTAGPEFRANTFTPGSQGSPAVAIDADGEFVVVWSGSGAGDSDGIFAQRFDFLGAARGGEFRVNTFTTGNQTFPDVTMDANGNFVVVWQGPGNGDTTGVFAQRFDAAGNAQGGEFRVNTITTNVQDSPVVAMDADGDFVVAWRSTSSIGFQRYNAAGQTQGAQQFISGGDEVFLTDLASDAGGNFILTYISIRQVDPFPLPPTAFSLASRYDANGELLAPAFDPGVGSPAGVAFDGDGGFVIVGSSLTQVSARRFDSAGVGGTAFTVSAIGVFVAAHPGVAMDAAGNFTITWQNTNQDGSGYGVYAQRYSAAGATVGSQFRVNTFTSGDQKSPAIAMSQSGNTILAWESAVQDPDGSQGVYGQLLIESVPPPTVDQSAFPFHLAPHRLQFSFSQNVSATLGTNDILLENLTTGQTIPSSDLLLSYDAGTNTATFSYNANPTGIAGVLADGNYRATLLAPGIFNPVGVPLAANHVFNFFFLNGDANHDGRVNLFDFNVLAAFFGQTDQNFSNGDFNYDTVVNLIDFNILASRFGQMVAPAASSFGRDPGGFDRIGEEIGLFSDAKVV